MNRILVKSLLLAAGWSAGLALAAEPIDVQYKTDPTRDAYSVGKQELELKAEEYADKASKLFLEGNYKDAAYNYAQAALIYDQLKDNSELFKDRLEKTREMIASSYCKMAQELAEKAQKEANVGDIDEAVALCKLAAEVNPASKKEMDDQIAIYEKMRFAADKKSRLSEDQVIPGLAEQKYQIAVLLKQAKVLFYTRQYEQARLRYQQVLLIDKINPEAIQGLRAANIKIDEAGQERYKLTHKRDMMESAWESVAPIVARKDVDVREAAGMNSTAPLSDADETKEMRDKLNNIIIPQVKFSGDENNPGTPLLVALKFLRDRSKANDPTGEGVNIFLYYPEKKLNNGMGMGMNGMGMGMNGMAPGMDMGGAAGMDPMALMNDPMMMMSGPNMGMNGGLNGMNNYRGSRNNQYGDEDLDDEAMLEEEEAMREADENSKYPLVNLNLVNKPLIEIIDALAQATNMKYKIEKHAVILAPKDAPLDDMQIKVFLFDDGLLEALGGSREPADLKSQLETYDVPFPSGAKVMFDPKFRVLIALNTPENLDKINDVILELRKQEAPPLVQIQVKFVEVEQNDLKELGFIQTLGRPGGTSEGETYGRLQFNANDPVLYDDGNKLFSYSRTIDGYNYNLTVNALNQLDSLDVLSSPKVLTVPNKKVAIKMTTEHYFEWDYEEGEYETNSSDGVNTYTYTPPWPEFEMQELGISMEVTPTVDTEKRLIMMNVSPWIRTFVGWSAYNYYVVTDEEGEQQTETVTDAEGNTTTTTTSNDATPTATEETIKRPIIAERTTDTNITIYDNETVVIGGIIKDQTQLIDDKVPFLGDIPLIGNFFKSKKTTVKKTNLLIFVTARMLKPDGSPYYQFDANGRPSAAGLGDVF